MGMPLQGVSFLELSDTEVSRGGLGETVATVACTVQTFAACKAGHASALLRVQQEQLILGRCCVKSSGPLGA